MFEFIIFVLYFFELEYKGQFGIGSNIKATTGFQSNGYSSEELVFMFKQTIKSTEKEF